MAENCSLLIYNNPNTKSLKLLIYSIFWRASISSNNVFNNIQINKGFENKLRKIILTYKTIKQNELKHLLNGKSNFEIFPFTIITAESFKDETSNILYVPFYNGAYRLIVDQYTFLLFRDKSEIPAKLFELGGNLKAEDCKMLIFSIELWQDNIIQPVMDNLAKMIKEANNKSR